MDKQIKRGLYLAYWPNGTYSVVYYHSAALLSDLFHDLDAFGNPFDAKVVRFPADAAIDFGVEERRGRHVIGKAIADRDGVTRVKFPSDIHSSLYLPAGGGSE